MTLQVGKRYCFSPWMSGRIPNGKHYYDGILESMDDKYGYLVCRDGEIWQITKENILPYKKNLKNKK